jgi:hypothetical protein
MANRASSTGEMIKDKEIGFLVGYNEEDILGAMLAVAGMSEDETRPRARRPLSPPTFLGTA